MVDFRIKSELNKRKGKKLINPPILLLQYIILTQVFHQKIGKRALRIGYQTFCFIVLNLFLSLEFRGLPLNLKPQQGHQKPCHLIKT